MSVVARGQGASPGVVSGPLTLTAAGAIAFLEAGTPAIFARNEMDATDVPGIRAAAGIVIARGGITNDGAVAARVLGKPCLVGCDAMVDLTQRILRAAAGEIVINEGDQVTLDAAQGTLTV